MQSSWSGVALVIIIFSRQTVWFHVIYPIKMSFLNRNRNARSKPRDIIVKFSTYRNRLTFYKQRTLLKERGHTGVFVNEDLTKFRSGLLYDARRLTKVSSVKGAWSSDGNVLVKDNDEKVHRVNVISDLFQFGFLVMGPGQPSGPPRVAATPG